MFAPYVCTGRSAHMIFLELLEAAIKLGLPVLVLSWLLIHRLYQTGRISKGADHKTVKSTLKQIKKGWGKEDNARSDFVQNKWMRFGGGFYGITAVATFILIEVSDALSFLWHFPGFGELFKGGLIDFIVGLLVNQFETFVSSFLWFAYWAGDDQTLLIWIVAPYAGYLTGLNLASKSLNQLAAKPAGWLKKLNRGELVIAETTEKAEKTTNE